MQVVKHQAIPISYKSKKEKKNMTIPVEKKGKNCITEFLKMNYLLMVHKFRKISME